jgi:LPXTG-motif cell wall-anchored protein
MGTSSEAFCCYNDTNCDHRIQQLPVFNRLEHNNVPGTSLCTVSRMLSENVPGAVLPHTGGPGTRLLYILGSILILGAGVLLWRRRRLI